MLDAVDLGKLEAYSALIARYYSQYKDGLDDPFEARATGAEGQSRCNNRDHEFNPAAAAVDFF
eukprot:1747656-Amphidinium_carterae.1